MFNKFIWLLTMIYQERKKLIYIELVDLVVSVEKVIFIKIGVAINLVMP